MTDELDRDLCRICGRALGDRGGICKPCRLREEGTTDRQLRSETVPQGFQLLHSDLHRNRLGSSAEYLTRQRAKAV